MGITPEAWKIIVYCVAFIQLVMLFAQVKLFQINSTLIEILRELKKVEKV